MGNYHHYNNRLTTWAIEHKAEWEIICGIKTTGIETNRRILEMVKEAGFQELGNMMACRVYQYIYDDMPENKK